MQIAPNGLGRATVPLTLPGPKASHWEAIPAAAASLLRKRGCGNRRWSRALSACRSERRKARCLLRATTPFTVFRIRLPRHCASTRERWFEVHQSVFGSASEAHLPSPFRRSRTFALAGARSVVRCLILRSPGGEPLVQDLAAASARLTPLRACRGRTSPVSVPCGTQLSWRPSRDFPVYSASLCGSSSAR